MKKTRYPDVSALVLTGGGSRRMQRDKAELPLPGGTLLEVILDQLQACFDDVVICSSRQLNHRSNGIHTVLDATPDQGPLAGIMSGLRVALHPRAFVVAGDMPVVHRPLVTRLVEVTDAEIVVPRRPTGLPEPLFAVYSRTVLPAVVELLAAGRRSILDLYPLCRTRFVPAPNMRWYWNINTLADYHDYLRHLGADHLLAQSRRRT
ncbi:MAG: molybdenum cofactor guanylyltransferase [Acidobacteria bacterium]|nr:molybdenum cofactor guanylyltransferase [Acidobacteriota bacterium]